MEQSATHSYARQDLKGEDYFFHVIRIGHNQPGRLGKAFGDHVEYDQPSKEVDCETKGAFIVKIPPASLENL